MIFCGKIGSKQLHKSDISKVTTGKRKPSIPLISLQYPHEDKAVQERQQKPKNQYIMEDLTMIINNKYGEEFNIIPSSYEENENKYQLNSVFAAGMRYYFSEWLNSHSISEDTTEDVFDNTSALRDGCRIDIHDNYYLDYDEERYQISYLWALENGIIYASVYDTMENHFIGDIEIKA